LHQSAVTHFTARIIQSHRPHIVCTADQHNEKWSGYIRLSAPDQNNRLLFSTTSLFDSEQDALKSMNDIVDEAMRMNLSM
jgi:hypothetical protein